nr:Gfo/Idh/MocA family oxidoreductase [Nannocystis sp. SCPEA4]
MSDAQVKHRIRVGIIGASGSSGWALQAHLPALATLPAYQLTAVATTRQASADEAARRFGATHAFDRASALIEHPDVDLVVVSVRAPEHAPLVRAALAARKHVFSEWPLGVSSSETRELAALAERAGVRTVVGLQRRLAPGVRYLRDLLAQGYVGRLRSATLHIAVPLLGATRPQSYAYTADAANGVNVLATVGAHFLDPVLSAVGEFHTLAAVVARQFDETRILETGEIVPVTAPDQVLISGTLSSGAVLSAHFETGKRNGPILSTVLTGTEGDLVLDHDLTLSGARGDDQPLARLSTPDSYAWSPRGALSDDAHQIAQLYAAFARDLAEGTSLAPSFRDAVRLHHLVDTIAEASTTGQRKLWQRP